MPAPRPIAIVAVLAALASVPACHKRVEDVEAPVPRDPANPRERCRLSFAACAPAASFGAGADVDTLDVRKLVHLASRLDVPDRLAASAAARLVAVAKTADGDTLLDMQEAMEDTSLALGRCRCDGFPPAIEKQGVAAIVASRAPPRATRSPEHWADEILAQLEALQAVSRRSAQLAVGGDTSGVDVVALRRDAERSLCTTVRAARDALAPRAFDACVDLVYRRRALAAGEGSAEVARGAVARYAAAPSCEAPAP